MRITIKDIAKKVGVTPATVSMVINNNPKISKKTRDKVLQAIKELNYHPNYIGRSLVKGKTNNIGMVATFFGSIFALEVIRGAEVDLRKTNYNMVLFSTRGVEETEKELLKRILYERRVDGLILISIMPDKEIMEEYKKNGVYVVLLEEVLKGLPSVKFDNIKGSYMAVDYLLKKGRKKVGIIAGLKGLNAIERIEGYKKAHENNDLMIKEDRVVKVINYSFEDGKEALDELLKKDKDIDAIFCAAGDISAIGVLERARELGIKIPDDIALIGFDDIYLASLTNPPLTTIRQPIFQMGKIAFNSLVNMIEKEKFLEDIQTLEPELIIRSSA